MKDKICLITGATSGIGKITAMQLAKMGAHVVIHGRSKPKIEEVQKQVINACGHSNVDIVLADLTSMQETRRMAEEFSLKYEKLDVLINNAGGIMNSFRETTEEGLEKTFALNVAAPFILTNLLLEKLKASKDARVIM